MLNYVLRDTIFFTVKYSEKLQGQSGEMENTSKVVIHQKTRQPQESALLAMNWQTVY